MTATARALLDKFERLSEREQKDLAAKILLLCRKWDWPALTDEELTQIAEERFLALDMEEARNAKKRRTR
jgi:hypothetical protein